MMYKLKLGNGQGWLLVAESEFRPWLRRFAKIMQLTPSKSDGYPHLIFTRKNPINQTNRGVHDLSVLKFWRHPDKTDHIICEMDEKNGHELDIIKMWHSLLPVYEWAQIRGGIPLHAALIEKDGQGVLLAAPGDTGKTTCCRRIPPSWKALCDDEALILLNKRKRYIVHPFPTWSDYLWKRSHKTWDVQRCVPLRAIFFLKQAKMDKAIALGQGRAATFINQLATQILSRSWRGMDKDKQTEIRKLLFDNACRLGKTIPAFILHFTLTGRFWEKIEEVLQYA